MEELWDAYDYKRVKKGYTVRRNKHLNNGDYHLVVHTCIFNSLGEMLVQKRKTNKDNWPGKWDFSSGGAVLSGEDSRCAAERELFEELSLHISLKESRPILTVYFDEGFDDYYIVDIPPEIEKNIMFTKDEIDDIKWVSRETFLGLIEHGETDILKSFVELLFDMHIKRGNHN